MCDYITIQGIYDGSRSVGERLSSMLNGDGVSNELLRDTDSCLDSIIGSQKTLHKLIIVESYFPAPSSTKYEGLHFSLPQKTLFPTNDSFHIETFGRSIHEVALRIYYQVRIRLDEKAIQ